MAKKGMNNPIAIASGVKNAGANTAKYVNKNKYNIILGATVLFGGYLAYRWFTKPRPSINYDSTQPQPSITVAQARFKANKLMSAMENPGTDEQAIFETLAGMTHNDFAMISDAFGMKYYDKVLGTEGGWLLNDKYDLTSWLRFELSNSELEHLQQIMPNVITFEN